jgi:hypothetical protein
MDYVLILTNGNISEGFKGGNWINPNPGRGFRTDGKGGVGVLMEFNELCDSMIVSLIRTDP